LAVKLLQEKLPQVKAKDVVGGLLLWALEIDELFPIY